jgi:3-phosphoglycerate kinase
MKYIRDIQSLLGVRVIIRVDFNVPIKNGSVIDDFRIKKVLLYYSTLAGTSKPGSSE